MFDWFKKPAIGRKTDVATSVQRVISSMRSGVSWMYDVTPERLASAIQSYRTGYLRDMALIIDRFEERDDTAMICARKNRSSLARCDHSVQLLPGVEDSEQAKLHKATLEKFWASITVTSAFSRNERGGMRLLKKQMADAISYGYKVHEIVWQPNPNGTLSATFISLPLWYFENTTGELRYLTTDNQTNGVEMNPGEWLVTCGDGVGIAASIACLYKRACIADWASYCERCGQPGIHAATEAPEGSSAWEKLLSSVAAFGKEWGIVTDKQTEITTVNANVGATIPQQPLAERMDRAIAALYRGADLSTLSKTDATGASLQGDETTALEEDACDLISETLNQQVDRFVIKFVLGDDVPLAGVRLSPTERANIDADIKIDNHLAALGVKLSKRDALTRYGRSEAEESSDALVPAPTFGQTVLPNEKNAARRDLDGLLAETLIGLGKKPFCVCDKPEPDENGICKICGKPIEPTLKGE